MLEGRREEGRLRRASGRTVGEMEGRGGRGRGDAGRDRKREICHLLSVPPAPLSCILPGGKYTLMSEGDRGKRMSEVAGWRGGWEGKKANRGGEKMDRIEKETKDGETGKKKETQL